MIDGKKIAELRQKLGWSQARLAKEIGTAQPTIVALEQGNQRSFKRVARLAKALGVGVQQIDPDFETGAQPQVESHKPVTHRLPPNGQRHKVPVFASAEGGGGALILSNEPIDWEDRPAHLEGADEIYVLLISGESMEPAFKPGERAWVDPRLGVIRDEPAIFYYVDPQSGEHRVMIKELVRQSETHWTVRQFNPPREFDLPKAEWPKAHRVIGKFTRR